MNRCLNAGVAATKTAHDQLVQSNYDECLARNWSNGMRGADDGSFDDIAGAAAGASGWQVGPGARHPRPDTLHPKRDLGP
jgi:hypothetical protein